MSALDWPWPRLIAHRGGSSVSPENTLPAFIAAARHGYRAVECDVMLTADGVPVLMHDDTLERTAGGRGRVADARLADLAGLDAGAWFAPGFTGTRIPTLAEAIACWQAHGLQAFIELKAGDGQDPERLGRTVAAQVAAVWRGPPPLLISFSVAALQAARSAAPQLPRGLLLDAPWPAGWRTGMAATGAAVLDIAHTAVTAERAAEVHAAGLGLAVWTCNDPARAAALLAMGVDAVTTDAIDRIAP